MCVTGVFYAVGYGWAGWMGIYFAFEDNSSPPSDLQQATHVSTSPRPPLMPLSPGVSRSLFNACHPSSFSQEAGSSPSPLAGF